MQELMMNGLAPGDAAVALALDSQGRARTVLESIAVARLTKGGTVAESVTLTLANTDYGATTAMVVGTKYLTVYCPSACIVAMGAATSSTNGVYVGAGMPTTFPVTVTGTPADDKPHAQSATAGAIITYTWMAD